MRTNLPDNFDTSNVTNMATIMYNWLSIGPVEAIGVKDFDTSDLAVQLKPTVILLS